MQWAGIGIYMPIYYAAYTFFSEAETYWWPLNREVRIQYAASLPIANIVGYAIPTMLMFVPWKDPYTIQNFEALWQVSPMLVPLVCNILGFVYTKKNNLKRVVPKANETFADLSYLKALYIITGTMGFLLHVYCMSKILFSSNLTFSSVFWPDLIASAKPLDEGIKTIFLTDFWGFYIASHVWLCMAAWDLKRMGRTDIDPQNASIFITLASFILGPGATMSAVWYWREDALARTNFVKGLA